jgi:hypothetical protein
VDHAGRDGAKEVGAYVHAWLEFGSSARTKKLAFENKIIAGTHLLT